MTTEPTTTTFSIFTKDDHTDDETFVPTTVDTTTDEEETDHMDIDKEELPQEQQLIENNESLNSTNEIIIGSTQSVEEPTYWNDENAEEQETENDEGQERDDIYESQMNPFDYRFGNNIKWKPILFFLTSWIIFVFLFGPLMIERLYEIIPCKKMCVKTEFTNECQVEFYSNILKKNMTLPITSNQTEVESWHCGVFHFGNFINVEKWDGKFSWYYFISQSFTLFTFLCLHSILLFI